ncbi:MAG: hypothetical protein GY832_40650 [Chloroflexi bacterium]|nr:hypothetical protein [Chloroflexota bacterium]
MNIDVLLHWGQGLLAFLDQQQTVEITLFDSEQVQEKLGWITRFRQPLEEWGKLLQLVSITESFVRQQGLSHGAHLKLTKRLQRMGHTDRTQRIHTELFTFVAQESAKARPGERLLGSSEVIVSVLGKLKYLEQDQAKSGFTGLLLSIGTMVSTTTSDVILKALETVSTKKVLLWCKETLGQSVQAKRRQIFASSSKSEQKWNQLLTAV